MKFKLGCASAVLMLLCFDTTWGGALKNSFTKNKATVETEDKNTKSNENATPQEDNYPAASASQSSTKSVPANVRESQQTAPAAEAQKPAKKKKEIKGNPVIYRIGKKEIRRNEILDEIKKLPKEVLNQASEEEVFNLIKHQKLMTYLVVEQAKKAGIDKEKEYLNRVEKAKEALLYDTYLLKEIHPKASSETSLQSAYRTYLVEFKTEPEIRVANISVGSEKEARQIIEALNKGASFEKLQKEKGLPSSDNSEQYVPVSKIHDDIKSKFKKIEKNAVTTEAIKLLDTYHIFKITDMRDSKPRTFEEMKPLLYRVLLKEEAEKLIIKLENQYKVQKFNEDGTPEVPPAPTSTPNAAPAA